eukprot:350306_1
MICQALLLITSVYATTVHPQHNNSINEIFCGDTVAGTIDPSDDQEYELFIYNITNVNIDSCDSKSDVLIGIFNDEDDVNMVGTGCNFTIPEMSPDTYQIKISPVTYDLFEATSYQLHIGCSFASSDMPINTTAKCNETITGYLTENGYTLYTDTYLYFNLTSVTAYLLFDSCSSEHYISLYLFDIDGAQIYHGTKDRKCGNKDQLLITNASSSIDLGLYILGIGGKPGRYQVSITCYPSLSDQIIETLQCGDSVSGYLVSHTDETYINFNLTSVTDYVLFDSCLSAHYVHLSLLDIDGTLLYEGDDNGSYCDKPQILIDSPINVGLYILKISGTNIVDYTHFDAFYGHWDVTVSCQNEIKNYSVCDGKQCWKSIKCCGDLVHYALYGSGYWNSTLFVVGYNIIYYTQITINGVNPQWNLFVYDDLRYQFDDHYIDVVQYKSSLFILKAAPSDYPYGDTEYNRLGNLFHVYLNESNNGKYQTDIIFLPVFVDSVFVDNPATDDFIVAGENRVWVITSSKILTYNIILENWDVSRDSLDNQIREMMYIQYNIGDISMVGGALTNDQRYIYIFTSNYGRYIWKYDVHNDFFVRLDTGYICTHSMVANIKAPNDNIYFAACYPSSYNTVIFDVRTDGFYGKGPSVDNTANVSRPRREYLAMMDDNILLLTASPFFSFGPSKELNLYYTITNDISINISNTITELWPSEGILFNYYLNDFSEIIVKEYILIIHCNGIINETIIMDTSNDDCICDGYNCQECSHHFTLSQTLTPVDNDIEELRCNLAANDSNLDVLILPQTMIFELTRCDIKFTNNNRFSYSDDPLIRFTFDLSQDCNTQIGINYSVSILSEQASIYQILIISITDTDENTVFLFDSSEHPSNKYEKFYNGFFEFYHPLLDVNHTIFNISFISNSIDLKIQKSTRKFPIQYSHAKIKLNTKWDKRSWYFLLLLLIPVSIVSYIYFRVKGKYKDAYEIENALVLIIGISQFDDKTWLLDGVKKCVRQLKQLWNDQYKYDVFVCNDETLYSTKYDIINFIDKHKDKLQNENSYKSVIVHILSHGMEEGNSFATSDKRKMNVELMMRELTEYANDGENLIKITFNHSCRGTANYDSGSAVRGPTNDSLIGDEKSADYNGTSVSSASPELSNRVVIWGNVKGRVVSDVGYFTDCICGEFQGNLNKQWFRKSYFRSLITNIGKKLQKETKESHLSEMNHTLRHDAVIFSGWENKNSYLKQEKEVNNRDTSCELGYMPL